MSRRRATVLKALIAFALFSLWLRCTHRNIQPTFENKGFHAAEVDNLRIAPHEYKFDWKNWIDVSEAYNYDELVSDPELYPTLNSYIGKELPYPLRRRVPRHELRLLAQKYIMDVLPAPQQVIQLPGTKNGAIVSSPTLWPVHHVDPSRDQFKFGLNEYIDLSEEIMNTTVSNPPKVKDMLVRHIERSEYHWNLEEEISQSSPELKKVLQAAASVPVEPKYFREFTATDVNSFGHHYDFKFCNRIETRVNRTLTIQLLMRAWSEFAQSYDIPYVIAHGTALGWYWNGMTLPWDVDIDIQVPVRTLHKLAWLFNSTLVVPHAGSGSDRAYYLDMNPFYIVREKAEGKNVIDARFIDITTGTYIDITGLANTAETKPDHIRCRNLHDYKYDSMDKFLLTRYEGALTYVPLKVKELLKQSFHRGLEKKYQNWIFNSKMRLWTNTRPECKVREPHPYEECFESDPLPSELCREDLESCDAIDIEEYEATKYYSFQHEEWLELCNEIVDLKNFDHIPKPIESMLIEIMNEDTPLLHRVPPLSRDELRLKTSSK